MVILTTTIDELPAELPLLINYHSQLRIYSHLLPPPAAELPSPQTLEEHVFEFEPVDILPVI